MAGIQQALFGGYGAVGDFESIATVSVGSGGTATISFTSIPSTYKHLQVRALMQGGGAAGGVALITTFNSDTAANYSAHQLYGDGSTVTAAGDANTSRLTWAPAGGFQSYGSADGASIFSAHIIDILDYANTSKYKTLRAIHGRDKNGAGRVMLESGNWRNTAAVSTITFTTVDSSLASQNFSQYTSFALYGLKG
jgi:hypothetical protein